MKDLFFLTPACPGPHMDYSLDLGLMVYLLFYVIFNDISVIYVKLITRNCILFSLNSDVKIYFMYVN